MKNEFGELKSRLEMGLGKIDQTACSAGSKVEDMELMVLTNNIFRLLSNFCKGGITERTTLGT